MPELIKKLTFDVGLLGMTLKGKLNTEYVVTQAGQTYRVREHDSLQLKRARDLEVFEVDMTLHPVKLSGKPETRDSALFFGVDVELAVRVNDPTVVVRVQQPMQMLAQKAGALVREVASKYEVDNYMQAQSAIHQALLRHPDFVITGLEVVSATIKIELGTRERVHIDEKARLKREDELRRLKAKQDAELEKMQQQYTADLAKTKANYDAQLQKEQLQRDLELRKEQMAYIEQLLGKGEAGLIGLKMLDPSFSMHDLVDQMLERRDVSESQKLQLLKQMIDQGMIEAHNIQPMINNLLQSISANIVPRTGSQLPASSSASAPALPENIPSEHHSADTIPTISSVPATPNDDSLSPSGSSFFDDDNDFDDRTPAGPSIVSKD